MLGRSEARSWCEGFIKLLLKGRFSTLHPVSQTSQPGQAPCPLSPHICKSLKLSGLDHRDRAGLCQTSDSVPRLNLNGLEALLESTGGRLSSLPLTSSPLSLSEMLSTSIKFIIMIIKFLQEHHRVESSQWVCQWSLLFFSSCHLPSPFSLFSVCTPLARLLYNGMCFYWYSRGKLGIVWTGSGLRSADRSDGGLVQHSSLQRHLCFSWTLETLS